MEGVGGGVVAESLVGEARGGHDLDNVEGGPRHVVEVKGGEVGELVEGGGFGVWVSGLDLAADFFEGFGDEGGFAHQVHAEAFYQVVHCALEQCLHD